MYIRPKVSSCVIIKKEIIALMSVKFRLWNSLVSSHALYALSAKGVLYLFFIFGLFFVLVAYISKLESVDINYHI